MKEEVYLKHLSQISRIRNKKKDSSNVKEKRRDREMAPLQPVEHGAIDTITKVISYPDRYTGAPIRAFVSQLQEDVTKPGLAVGAAMDQFGEDPKHTATGKEIMAKAGLPTEETIDIPGFSRVFGKVSPAGMAGLPTEMALDITNVVPLKPIAQFLKRGGRAVAKGILRILDKTAENVPIARHGYAAFKKYFVPAAEIKAKEYKEIAKKIGVTLTKEVKDMVEYDQLSTMGRALRSKAEGVLAQKYNQIMGNTIKEVNSAFDWIKRKYSPENITEKDAGKIIIEKLKEARERLFESAAESYSLLPNQMKAIAPRFKNIRFVDIGQEKIYNKLEQQMAAIKQSAIRGKTTREAATATRLNKTIKTIDNFENLDGSINDLVQLLRDIGKEAYNIKGKEITVDIRQYRDMYDAISAALIKAHRNILGDEVADALIKNNTTFTKFFVNEGPIKKAVTKDQAEEKIFRQLVLHGDSKTLSSIKELIPDSLDYLKYAFLDNLAPKNINEKISFSTVYNKLKNQKKNVVAELFTPSEIEELSDVLKLGTRLNIPFMSTSGTGGSLAYQAPIQSTKTEIAKNIGMDFMSEGTRLMRKPWKEEMIDSAQAIMKESRRPYILGGTSDILPIYNVSKMHQSQKTNQKSAVQRRLERR